jgi:hypothetical protein
VEVPVHLYEDFLGGVPRLLVVAHVVEGETVDSRLKMTHQPLTGEGVAPAAAREKAVEVYHW